MKIKKTEVKSEDERLREDALSIAKQTAEELSNLRGEFETSQLAVKDYLDKSGGILKYAIDKLSEAAQKQPSQIVNVEPLNQLIKTTLESFELKLEQIQTACETIKVPDVNNEFSPDITLEAPEVDLTKLEDLLRKELPKLFEKFLEAIPEVPPLDLTELDKKFQKMFELLEKNLKKQMPMFVGGGGGGNVPTIQTPTGVAVPISNPDGTPIASSSETPVYNTNDIEDSTISYFGKTASDGTYQIVRVTATSVSYATIINNGGVTSYTDAWTDRATLTYGRYDEAF